MWLVKALLIASTIINYHIIPQVICEMWNCWACSKHNVTMQTAAEFASNSTANIKLSKHPSFLFSWLWTSSLWKVKLYPPKNYVVE